MIDLAYINDITDGDTETKKQIITLFINQSKEIESEMRKALEDNNIEALSKIAHLAKSTSRVVGLTEISESMEKLQNLAAESAGTDLYPALANHYLSNIGTVRDLLSNEIANMGS